MPIHLAGGDGLLATESTLLGLAIVIIAAGLVARLARMPYTTILVVAGLGLAAVQILPDVQLTPELVLLIFLPPLAFEAAFHLDFEQLRENLAAVSTFALAGVAATMLVVAAVLVAGLGWNWPVALLFGSLVAATDPVSVVAVFRELGVTRRLSVLLEGESLFNDGTGIVLFRLMLAVVLAGSFNPAAGALEFFRLVVGGIALGGLGGYLVARLLASIDDYLIEISVTAVLAWGIYLLAENDLVHVSGVIAVVVAGLVLGNYGGRTSFSPTTKIVLTHVLEFIAFVANSFIFVLIGLHVNFQRLGAEATTVLWAIAAVLIARAVTIYGLSLPLRILARPLPWRWQHILFWGGLRGGLTLALALSMPADVPQRESLTIAAFGVVLFTLVAQALTIQPLIRFLQLVPFQAGHREHSATRARLLALQAAERRIEALHAEGQISPEAYEVLTSQYSAQEEQLQYNLRMLRQEHPDLTERELTGARVEGLRAERSALQQLNRQGVILPDVYRQLLNDIDSQLSQMAEQRARPKAAPQPQAANSQSDPGAPKEPLEKESS